MKPMIFAGVMLLLAGAAMAETAAKLGPMRAFLIWEDSGQMSPVIATGDQVSANDRKHGESSQARVDVVIEAVPESTVDQDLQVRAKSLDDGKIMLDQKLPVGFFAKEKIVRSVIVNHWCEPFEVEATLGGARRTLTVNLSCGD